MQKYIALAVVLLLAFGMYLALDVRPGARRDRSEPASTVSDAAQGAAITGGAEAPSLEAETRRGEDAQRESATEPAAPRGVAPKMRLLVRDAVDGRPIEGALATLHDRATPVPARTDGDGACVLPLAQPGESVRLRVDAPGHVHWHRPVVCGPNVALELLRSGTIHGLVLAADTDGPIAGATLAVLHRECDGCELEPVASDARGEYELASVPLIVEAAIEVRAEGFATQRRFFALPGDEPRVHQDIHLERGVELAGRVEDWISGRGIVGARVGDLVAGADGRFEGRVLARGTTSETTLDVRAPGYAALRAVLDTTTTEELVLRLPELAWLEGRVMDRAGAPLGGATVSVLSKGPARNRGALLETSPIYEVPAGWSYSVDAPAATSAADGRYSAPVLPWSIDQVATASVRGLPGTEVRFAYAGEPGSVRAQDWWLGSGERRAFVAGFVQLRGRACRVRGTVAWSGTTRSGSQRVEQLEPGKDREPPGWFAFEVEPGEVRLSALLDLLPELPSAEVVLHVPAGATRSVDLEVDAPTATISGSVHFEDGAPVAGARVGACCTLPGERSPELESFVFTDSDGQFEHYVFDLGLAYLLGTDELQLPARPGDHTVDFVLRRSHRFFVRAREAASGRALVLGRDVELRARTYLPYGFLPLDEDKALPDADGWYEFSLQAKELDLLALPRASELPERSECLLRGVRLDGPEPARIELVLARGVELGVELAQGGAPWPADHRLLLLPEDVHGTVPGPRARHATPLDELEARCTVRFDDQGRAALHGLAPGSYRFKVLPPDLAVEPEFVRVERDAPPIALRWGAR